MSSFATAALIKLNVTYIDIVAAAVLAYDYLLTVEREARLVWPVPWNFGKVLFLLTRYPVFADTFMILYHQFAVLSPEQCQGLFRTIGFQLGIGTLIAESILAVRTWVIWRRDRRVGIILITALVAFWIPVFYFLRIALYSLVFTTPPHPHTPGCFLSKQNPILWVVFVFIMVFETLILGLTLLKGIEHFRGTNSTLVTVLYRDGIMNYIYLCILSIINVTVLLTAPHGYSTLLTGLQRAMHSILSARILLHLREAAVLRTKVTTVSHGAATSSIGGFNVGRRTGPGYEFKSQKSGATKKSSMWGTDTTVSVGDYGFGFGGAQGYGTGAQEIIKKENVGAEDLFPEKDQAGPETVMWFGEGEDREERPRDNVLEMG